MLKSFPPDLLLRCLFLTDPDLIGPATEMLGSGPDAFRAWHRFQIKTRSILHTLLPSLPERQRTHVFNEVFSDTYEKVVLRSWGELSQFFFRLLDGEIRFRQEGILPWCEYFGTRLSTPPLMAACLARERLRSREYEPLIEKLFSGPVFPLPENQALYSLGSSGFIETHMHFNNSACPALVWCHALEKPALWLKKTRRDKDQSLHWDYILPNHPPERAARLLYLGLALRDWLTAAIIDTDTSKSYNEICRYAYETVFWDHLPPVPPTIPLEPSRHPGEFLPGGRSDNLLVAEGAFWTHCLDRLRKSEPLLPSFFPALFHLYGLILSLVHRFSTHQHNMKGFDLFEILAKSPFRDGTEKRLVRDRLVQMTRTGRLKGLEIRIAGKDKSERLYSYVTQIGRASRELKKRDQPRRFGVLCHFIKETDKDRRRHREILCRKRGTSLPVPLRHEALRGKLLRQLAVFLTVRLRYPDGHLLCAIDGANSEFHARPEVFAPIFREVRYRMRARRDLSLLQKVFISESPSPVHFTLQNGEESRHFSLDPRAIEKTLEFLQIHSGVLGGPVVRRDPVSKSPPPIRFTFHVGEEFHHLASGLRAVDEALEFLDLPAGSRIGHGLALGMDPRLWMERVPDVRIPRLEWLDNLVWLHNILPDHTEFRDRTDSMIAALFREVYGWRLRIDAGCLHDAWVLRQLAVTKDEKNLESQDELYEKLTTSISPFSLKIHRLYHESPQVLEKGDEIITLRLDKEFEELLVEALHAAQEKMIDKLDKRGIAIECCPTSNLRISQLEHIRDHPLFRWSPPDAPDKRRLRILLATDNPGLCQISLPTEYLAVLSAAQQKYPNLSSRALLDWLEQIRQDTEMFTFLPKDNPVS